MAERDITLRFRGSRNQRLIDVQRTLARPPPPGTHKQPLVTHWSAPASSDHGYGLLPHHVIDQ